LQSLDSNATMDMSKLSEITKRMSRSDGSFPCCKVVQAARAGATVALEEPDARGKTPMQYAAFMGHEECIAALIEAGANPNAQNATGMTALHFAAMSMFSGPAVQCVSKLTQQGADPTIQNVAGKTCLDCVKNPEVRKQMQAVMGVAVHEYKGRKTKLEREQDGDPNTSDDEEDDEEGDEEDSELSDDDSEWEEWDWEWEEGDEEGDEEADEEAEAEESLPYTHCNKPRIVSQVRVEVSTPGPFHHGLPETPKKYGI